MNLPRFVLATWCFICASNATAHEFWIEPEDYQVAASDRLVAKLRNGQNFEGVTLGYFDRNISRFDVVTGDNVRAVEARLGDNPALDMPAEQEGLTIILHETTPSFLIYKEWEKFQAFADHKDFPDIAKRHEANGFPPPPFKERYSRHAKSLVAVGNPEGEDRAFGLKTEFVALTNPYASDFDGTMRVRLFYAGTPRPDAQVEVFDRRPDGEVETTLHRTDSKGIAKIVVVPGHEYLFDAVVLRPTEDTESAVWDTFWAALTFAVPMK